MYKLLLALVAALTLSACATTKGIEPAKTVAVPQTTYVYVRTIILRHDAKGMTTYELDETKVSRATAEAYAADLKRDKSREGPDAIFFCTQPYKTEKAGESCEFEWGTDAWHAEQDSFISPMSSRARRRGMLA